MGNQNQLTDENIDKIITTFRNRIEEPKYSHVAKLQEVNDNDYNLNIPRYVETFEIEEGIVIDEVAKSLQGLELEMKETDKFLVGFCAELGISAPF